MNRMKRSALLTKLVQRLRDEGSWGGETHVQKVTYFLQELMEVPLDFDFILYKHGPYSFDLHDEIAALRGDGLLTFELHTVHISNLLIYVPISRGFSQRLWQGTTAGSRWLLKRLATRGSFSSSFWGRRCSSP